MITTLHIENVGIINDLSINLNEGFNVLTGETGAGKTLIIGSLAILAGGRFSKEMIRKGENQSFVELCMYEPEHENAIDGNIIKIVCYAETSLSKIRITLPNLNAQAYIPQPPGNPHS